MLAIGLLVIACASDPQRDAVVGDSAASVAVDTSGTGTPTASPVGVATCTTSQVDGQSVTACEIPPASVRRLQIAPAPQPAKRAWTIAALDSSVRAGGRRIRVATNAGIFQKNGKPSGLLIRNGVELSKLVVGAGPSAKNPNRCAVNF